MDQHYHVQSFGVGRSLVLRRPIEEYGFTPHRLPTETDKACIIRFMVPPWCVPLHRVSSSSDSDELVHCSRIGPIEQAYYCDLCGNPTNHYLVIALINNAKRLVLLKSEDLHQIQEEMHKDEKQDPYHLNFLCRLNQNHGQKAPYDPEADPRIDHFIPTYNWERVNCLDPLNLKAHQAEAEEMLPMLEDVNRNIETANRYLIFKEPT